MLAPLIHLIFPENCHACGRALTQQLKHVCLQCRNELPFIYQSKSAREALEKLFWGKVQLIRSAAYLKFEKGSKVQQLIHRLKYEDQKEIGISLGEMAASALNEEDFFHKVDYLIPVPIHPLKERKRGYNQSEYIAKGIENQSKIKLLKRAIIKRINTDSQTRKGKFKRWTNVSSSFEVCDASILKEKHLLLIDDVVTTGSTIEACAQELQKVEGVKLSILAMAFTY